MRGEGESGIVVKHKAVVAHHTAKFSCCGQKLICGPLSHFLAYFEAVYVICVFLKICLYFIVKKDVGVA